MQLVYWQRRKKIMVKKSTVAVQTDPAKRFRRNRGMFRELIVGDCPDSPIQFTGKDQQFITNTVSCNCSSSIAGEVRKLNDFTDEQSSRLQTENQTQMAFDSLPKRLCFELTSKCNYRCPFCYCVWHEFPELAKPERDTVFWLSVLDCCAENEVNDILFTGGEVLLRTDLCKLLSYARKRLPVASLGLFTNTALMSEEFLYFCRRKKIRLSTSLQGLSTHGAMTGTRRRCFRTLEWIARASELHWSMSVGLTATRVNRREFADMYCAAALANAKDIQMGTMMLGGRGRTNPDLALTQTEWEELKSEIRSLPDYGVAYVFCDEQICECRPQPEDFQRNFSFPMKRVCKAGIDFGVIGPNGKIRKCLHTVEAFGIHLPERLQSSL